MSTVTSPALISRVTPRSPKKWKPPKSYPGKRSRHKAGANFNNVASTPPFQSPPKKEAYIPGENPKPLIERLSPSTYMVAQGAGRPPEPPVSPTKFSDRLMRSERLSSTLSPRKDMDMPVNTSVDPNKVVIEPLTNTADNVDAVCIFRF
jgi:hypothetical protein